MLSRITQTVIALASARNTTRCHIIHVPGYFEWSNGPSFVLDFFQFHCSLSILPHLNCLSGRADLKSILERCSDKDL